MNRADELIPTNPEEGLDSGWPAFLAAAKATDPNFEKNYGVKRLAADYAMLPVKMAKAMEHATGHKSEELFKIGYMLLLVQERATYTLDDLAHVMSSNWNLLIDDLDLIDRVRDKMSLSCNFVEVLNRSRFRHFVKHLDNYNMVESFLERFDYFKTDEPEIPHAHTLTISGVKVVLCAEIWCTWAYENRNPLPSKVAFVELFGPGMAAEITEFTRRLMNAFTLSEFKHSVVSWYGYDVAFLRAFNALVQLVEGLPYLSPLDESEEV
ncbi:hypothetical protein E0Z10_g7265 [Xylaria hypoxylon]|uniref:Uncharacterized protein n=1 Tax=Xylaria hypoxylon TaxID=37992 RepID=A0A4Z0YQT2_9PEZI|nr:hypothetical protein E0Z10_g7265 [Xylaria hypoxylon]